MSALEFTDSKMRFSFPSESAFHIEKSNVVRALGQGVKICEAIVRMKDRLFFIEAKSSFSNPSHPEPFKKNIEEIVEKFRCSWTILTGLHAERPYPERDQLPEDLRRINAGSLPFMGVLILRDHPDDKLLEVDEAINQAISRKEKRLFCIDGIKVINGAMALKYGFIRDFVRN